MLKTCTKCKISKDISCFWKGVKYKDGYRSRCIECMQKYRKDNQETLRAHRKKWALKNKEKIRSYRKKWKQKNPQYASEWIKKREANVPEFKLQNRVSHQIRKALLKEGIPKKISSWSVLPYTPTQLRKHLESQFENWMSWDNYGMWHIDHIVPQSKLRYDSFNHPNFQKCWALENLRPLEARANLRKGAS